MRQTRGLKRSGGPLTAKENIQPTATSTTLRYAATKPLELPSKNVTSATSASAASVGVSKFGFRGPSIPTVAQSSQPLVQPPTKRRKTTEFDEEAEQQENVTMSIEPALATVDPLVLGPCDSIMTLWRETMMDESMNQECKAALAGKISAAKFDYKVNRQQQQTECGRESRNDSVRACVSHHLTLTPLHEPFGEIRSSLFFSPIPLGKDRSIGSSVEVAS